jgi:NAD(P)-dependent dehydrogenase (short-subunit alcohol dehydrogenase family)
MKLKPIEEQVVVIVGANSGIGRAAALLLAEKGARVVVAGRSQEEMDRLADEIRLNGGRATAMTVDVTDYTQMVELAAQTTALFGRIDTWVQSAAVMMYASFEDTTPEEFKRMLDVNLLGQIYGAKAALPHLRRTGRGALIHLTSVEAVRSLPLQSAYAASKHGVVGFIDALRLELQKDGIPISVTNIKPAGINTPLYEKALTKIGTLPRPVPPIYEPELVAQAILYAAQNPVRDMTVGAAGKLLAVTQRISPRIADGVLQKIAYKGMHTDKPKSPNAPNNLYHHQEGYDRVHGPFEEEALPFSTYSDTRSGRALRWGLAAAAVAGAAVVFGRRAWSGSN